MKTFFRWISRIFLSASLLPPVVSITAFFQIPIDLIRFKKPLESIASGLLKNPVYIEQSIILSTSRKPDLAQSNSCIKTENHNFGIGILASVCPWMSNFAV